MEPTNYQLLQAVVARYEDDERPVTPEELTGAVDCNASTVTEKLATLEECDLLVVAGDGYRPTVTAHELLALDIENPELIIVDTDC